MMKHRQIDDVERNKLSCNAIYILFSVYNTDPDIHHVDVFLFCNGTDITLRCQQTHNCCFQMKLCT